VYKTKMRDLICDGLLIVGALFYLAHFIAFIVLQRPITVFESVSFIRIGEAVGLIVIAIFGIERFRRNYKRFCYECDYENLKRRKV